METICFGRFIRLFYQRIKSEYISGWRNESLPSSKPSVSFDSLCSREIGLACHHTNYNNRVSVQTESSVPSFVVCCLLPVRTSTKTLQ